MLFAANAVFAAAAYAFTGCSAVTALAIPDTLTNIGQYAFQLREADGG